MGLDWSGEELRLLSETPLFQGLERKWLLWGPEHPASFRERFSKGTAIYSPKRFRRCLGVLLTGRARVSKGSLVVNTLEQGGLFGAAALFNRREDYETTITALEPCTVAFFPEAVVAELLLKSPAFCGNYVAYLSERIHFLNRKIQGLTAPGAVGKLALYLGSEGRSGGRVACTATELAQRLDVSRATVYRAFETLEDQGIIRRRGKTVEILDLERLKEMGADG